MSSTKNINDPYGFNGKRGQKNLQLNVEPETGENGELFRFHQELAISSGQATDNFIKEINSEITGGCMIPMTLPKKDTIRIINEAKKWFYKNYEDSLCEEYYVIPYKNFKTDEFKRKREIVLPGPRPDGSGRIFSINDLSVQGEQKLALTGKSAFVDEDFSLDRFIFSVPNSINGSIELGDNLMYYVINESMYDMARQVLVNRRSFTYNRLSRKLKILGENPNSNVVMTVYSTIADCDLFEDEIFFRYVVARVKIQLGTMLTRFTYNLPGNIQINGDDVRTEGKEELEQVRQEIKDDEGVDYFLTS